MAEVEHRYRQVVPQTRQRAIAVDTGTMDQRTEILGQLGKFATAVTGEIDRQQKAEIETKKALGASRAAQDMMKTEQERQGITEDDVLATKLSYNAIMGKHETMQAGNSFTEWYQSNPSATDQEIADKKAELYQPLFEKYGDDENSLKQLSLQVQESQFALVGVQDKIKSQYTYKKNWEALGISISDLMAVPDADIDSILDQEIPARAKALGLTEFDMKKAVMENAAMSAAEGDARMLDKLEQLDWSKDSAVVKKARGDYEKFIAFEQAPAIGNVKGDIHLEMLSLKVPWDTTLRRIEQVNKQWPGTYNDDEIESLKVKRARKAASVEESGRGLSNLMKGLYDVRGLPLADDFTLSDAQKKKLIKDADDYWATLTQQRVEEEDMSPTEARKLVVEDQLTLSKFHRIAFPSLERSLQSAINLPLDELTGEGPLPDYVLDSFSLFKRMDDSSIDIYLDGKDAAFALNFKKFAETMDDEAAYRMADRARRNPYGADRNQLAQQDGEMATVMESLFDPSLWQEWVNDAKEVPEYQQKRFMEQLKREARDMLYSRGLDTTANANYVKTRFENNTFQLNDGKLVNVPKASLYANISAGRGMDIEKTGDYVEAFMLTTAPLIKEFGGTDISEVQLDFTKDGKSFILMDKYNEQIGSVRFLTESIYDIGREADLEALRKENTSREEQAARITKQMREGKRPVPVVPTFF